MPTIFFYLMFMTLTLLPWYTGILLAAAEFFGMHHVCSPSIFLTRWKFRLLTDCNTGSPQQIYIY